VAVREPEGKGGRLREAEGDGGDAAPCRQDAVILLQKPHPGYEEERLDEWKSVELGARHGSLQQLPLGLHRTVRVDQHRRLR